MDNWNGDQYSVDMDSRYPIYSDVQTSDLQMMAVPRYVPTGVGSFEDKFQAEQQGVPSYYGCRCKNCPLSSFREGPQRPPMRHEDVDHRAEAALRAKQAWLKGHDVTPKYKCAPVEPMQINYLFIMFVIVLFVCLFLKNMDLSNQIASLRSTSIGASK